MTPKLFKQENNVKAEEIKKYLPVNVTLNYRSLAPYLALAEQKYIASVIGNEQFEKIIDYYNSNTQSFAYSLALEMIQAACVNLAYFEGYDTISIMLTDNGAMSQVDKEHKLYRYQEINLKKTLKEQGYNNIDSLLKHLEKNLPLFPEYRDSTQRQKLLKSLITTTEDINSVFCIENSRLIYIKLKYYIQNVENLYIPHRIGKQFYQNIIQDKNNALFLPFIDDLKNYIIFKAISEAITELKKLPTEKGLIFETTLTREGTKQEQVDTKELIKTSAFYNEKAEAYLSNVINFLNENKNQYPLYKEFCGENNPARKIITRDNTNKKTFWL